MLTVQKSTRFSQGKLHYHCKSKNEYFLVLWTWIKLRLFARPLAGTDIDKAIVKLESLHLDSNNCRKQASSKPSSSFDRLRLLAVLRFLRMLKKDPRSRVCSSERVAEVVFGKEGASYRSRTIRDWGDHYLKHFDLPLLSQGKYQKTKSLIDDEDVRAKCLSFLRSVRADKRDAVIFQNWINSELKGHIGIDYDLSVSKQTAINWLVKLNFQFEVYRQGSAYVDGHERPDVINYRTQFVNEFALWQKRMESFEGEDMETCISPDPIDGESKVVLVTQDECCFQAHDGKRQIWQEKARKEIRPKGEGASIMVSAFLCQCHGLLRLPSDLAELNPEISPDSTVIIHPGVNKDGYFTNDDLAEQTKKMLKIFGVLHPGCTALVAYDNSSNHHAMAKDALVANRLNLKDGGKNVHRTRDGWFLDSAGIRIVQSMTSTVGIQKGIASTLQERGLFVTGMRLKDGRNLLSAQPDFRAQQPLLKETVEGRGHHIIFYPKFHPEFNFIEMYWGACKAFTRKNCDYSWNALILIVPLALNTVSLTRIRKFARKSERYIDAYRPKDGDIRLTAAQVEYAVKKYRSHRRIPGKIMTEL